MELGAPLAPPHKCICLQKCPLCSRDTVPPLKPLGPYSSTAVAGAPPCSCIEHCCLEVSESLVRGLGWGVWMLWGADSALHLCPAKGLGLLLW